MDETKIIVTHRRALDAKYGAAVSRVMKAVDRLIAADARRGIVSRVVALDRAADVRPFGTPAMRGATDREGAKRVIDAIDRKLRPHYILILGAWDVVPMQLLDNVMGSLYFWPGGDPDEQVPSDLPYACDAKFSTRPDEFQGPTRVVGRLPDVPGARHPAFLVKVLDLAAKAKPLPREAYDAWLGITTATWKGTSAMTARQVFGSSRHLLASPPQLDRWSRAKLRPRVHFINCHGGPGDPAYRGELTKRDLKKARIRDPKAQAMPAAISSVSLKGNVTRGTVVAAECCFGAEVFGPATPGARRQGKIAVALQYLEEGAYGFFGATTTAYGPKPGQPNTWSDVICELFLKRVLAGASLGRAALMARHDYVNQGELTDPTALKTLAQFCLLGDPSIHPVERKSRRRDARPTIDRHRFDVERRKLRRAELRLLGEDLAAVSRKLGIEESVPDEWLNSMVAVAREFGLDGKLARVFTLTRHSLAFAEGDRDAQTVMDALQVLGLVGRLEADELFPTFIAVMAEVKGGKVMPPKVGYSK